MATAIILIPVPHHSVHLFLPLFSHLLQPSCLSLIRPPVSPAGGAASSAQWEECRSIRLLLHRGAGGAQGAHWQLLLLQQEIRQCGGSVKISSNCFLFTLLWEVSNFWQPSDESPAHKLNLYKLTEVWNDQVPKVAYFLFVSLECCCIICVWCSGAYDWAQKTLKDHAKDKRPYIYTRE